MGNELDCAAMIALIAAKMVNADGKTTINVATAKISPVDRPPQPSGAPSPIKSRDAINVDAVAKM